MKATINRAKKARPTKPAPRVSNKPSIINKYSRLDDEQLITVREAAQIARVGESTCWRYTVADPTFPRLVRLSPRSTKIRLGDFRRWLISKKVAA